MALGRSWLFALLFHHGKAALRSVIEFAITEKDRGDFCFEQGNVDEIRYRAFLRGRQPMVIGGLSVDTNTGPAPRRLRPGEAAEEDLNSGLESRHGEDPALSAATVDKSREDCGRIRRIGRIGGRGNSVQADIVERPAFDHDASDRDDRAVLTHANDRVIACVGDVKVGAIIQCRVARPVDVVAIPFDRRQIDRQIQRP
jgi:hypothetical protein